MHKPSSSANGILLISNQYESTVMLTGERKLLVKQQILLYKIEVYMLVISIQKQQITQRDGLSI